MCNEPNFLQRSPLGRLALRAGVGLAAALGAVALSASVASAATITVNTGVDEFDTIPNATCSLREAIQSANIDTNFGGCVGLGPYGDDEIVFDPSVTVVTLSIVNTSPSTNDNNADGDLDINDPSTPNNLRILGPAGKVTVQGGTGWNDRIFDIFGTPQGQITLENLTIRNGSMTLSSPATPAQPSPCQRGGGGIRHTSVAAQFTLVNVEVRENQAAFSGGGICDEGRAFAMQNSQVLSNTATGSPLLPGRGGGIFVAGTAGPFKLILTSTVALNSADITGGGIHNEYGGGLIVNASTVRDNIVGALSPSFNPGNGGGLWSSTRLNLNNTDVLSNTAVITGTTTGVRGGGGVYNSPAGQLNITGGRVSFNRVRTFSNGPDPVPAGGGIWNGRQTTLTGVSVTHNVVERNSSANNVTAIGGGIFNASTLNVTNSRVDFNLAEADRGAEGGGIYNGDRLSGAGATLTLQNSTVSTNTATVSFGFAQGGGVHSGFVSNDIADVQSSELRNNLAQGNFGANGGGVNSSAVITLTNSVVISNAALSTAQPSNGGGVNTSSSSFGTVLIMGTQILNNLASFGGGWYNTAPSVQMNSSQVRFNATLSTSSPEHGGGIYNTQGMFIVDSFITDNKAHDDGGGIYNSGPDVNVFNSEIGLNSAGNSGAGNGGGVHNTGAVFLNASRVLTNTAPVNGGGIYHGSGFFGIFGSTLRANSATQRGGGVYNAATVVMNFSTIGGQNQAQQGGGIYNAITGAIQNATVITLTSNTATDGAGLFNAGTVDFFQQSAVVNNTASSAGGGIYNAGTLNSVNNTVSGNGAPNGGGVRAVGGSAYLTHTTVASNTIGNGVSVAGGAVNVWGTLLAYNAANNCSGALTEFIPSLSSDTSCTGFTFSGVNPLLAPLAFNGGQTLNHALLPGSPALDQTGNCNSYNVFNDQRGVSRPQGTACDIGAFELEEADLQVSKSATPSPVIAGQTLTYTVVVTNNSTSGAANSLVLTDTLLGGATFGGVVSSGGFTLQSSTSSQAVFTLPSLAAGASVTLVFTATAPGSGPVTNVVTVTSGNPDPNPANNTDSVLTPVSPAAFLSATKAQSFVPFAPGVILPGGQVTYTIVVTNNGPSTVPMGVLDTLASGVTFIAASITPGTCSYSAPTVACSTGVAIPPGGSATALITVTAPVASNTTFTNVAQAVAPAFPSTPFNSNVVTLTTAAQAELRTFKTATPSPVFAGQPVTYVVSVQNFGPDPAANVVITDVFQGGATFGSVIGTSGGATLQSSASNGVTFTVSSLPAGGTAVMTYTVIAPTAGVITNTATARSDAVDPSLGNNSFSTTTPVTPVAFLSATKAQDFVPHAPGIILPGGQVTYTIVVTNNGPSAAPLTVQDTLASGVTFVAASITPGICSYSAPTVTCSTGVAIPAGSTATALITVTAPSTPSAVFTNVASASSTAFPGTPFSSNVVTLTTAAQADLSVSKAATPSPVLAGQTVTYVVTVTNNGPDSAANVVITDVFQGGATFGSVIGTSGGATLQSSASNGVTFTVTSLANGASAVMTYTVTAPTAGVITNTATVKSDELDPVLSDNAVTVTTPVTPVANLQISKTQSFVTAITGTIPPGGTITYTLQVTNTGPSAASLVTVTDNLPTGMVFVSATGSGWTCSYSAPTVTCTRPTLSIGAAPVIQIVASAPMTQGLVLTNTATVNAATFPNTPVTSNSVSVKVQHRVYAPIARKP